jgi:hypothetical protein
MQSEVDRQSKVAGFIYLSGSTLIFVGQPIFAFDRNSSPLSSGR